MILIDKKVIKTVSNSSRTRLLYIYTKEDTHLKLVRMIIEDLKNGSFYQ
jgi:hypothetical protein